MKALVLLAAFLMFAAPVQALPDLETVLFADGSFVFAGDTSAEGGPDLIELLADGPVTFYFVDSAGPTTWPNGNPPWGDLADGDLWPSAVPVGNIYYTLVSGVPRPMDMLGIRADTVYVTMNGATQVVISCSKKR